jgi:hypothetical protein
MNIPLSPPPVGPERNQAGVALIGNLDDPLPRGTSLDRRWSTCEQLNPVVLAHNVDHGRPPRGKQPAIARTIGDHRCLMCWLLTVRPLGGLDNAGNNDHSYTVMVIMVRPSCLSPRSN